MKQFSFLLAAAIGLVACGEDSGTGKGVSTDSASTAPLTNPTYNPTVEADSAATHMNLDSSQTNGSGSTGSDTTGRK